ncbi:Glyoxylate reductase [Ascochyta rabiei]|uniref:NAD binding n=1 Tax=Didymella rabiei TaxID=5454 RepID=A0A163GG66_DIDRA|nr:Glyoxylate reductase [Ascochyta rabiei]KZM24841.1 NAD binding [Ascochyta rabiei]UPX13018.1 Glyoxylate reductase [Ascochyta rabiei]
MFDRAKSFAVKPKVLYLGVPKHQSSRIRDQYYKLFDIDILDVSTRAEALEGIPEIVASRGPYQALVCRLGPQPYEPFDSQLLAPLLPDLRIVVSAQRGFDDFNVDWMTRQGIWFCNTKHAMVDATAEMALFLIMAVIRNTSRAEQSLRSGSWRGRLPLSRDLRSTTLGIIGMGNIGVCLAHKAVALGMHVNYHTKSGKAMGNQVPAGSVHCATLDELLQSSDVVSVHCPLDQDTLHLLGEKQFHSMKDGSYLINTSRGGVVDSQALIRALESGKLAGAGLDVFENEPTGIDPYFLKSDKVVPIPHMGGLTEGSFELAEQECLTNVQEYFSTGRPCAPLNNVDQRVHSVFAVL